jgi:hypothetical protein
MSFSFWIFIAKHSKIGWSLNDHLKSETGCWNLKLFSANFFGMSKVCHFHFEYLYKTFQNWSLYKWPPDIWNWLLANLPLLDKGQCQVFILVYCWRCQYFQMICFNILIWVCSKTKICRSFKRVWNPNMWK